LAAEGLDVRGLDLGEVLGLLGLHHVGGQEVHPVLAGPRRRAQAAAAVPRATGQAGGVRLHAVRPLLDDALAAGEGRRALAAEEPQQPQYAPVAEVLGVGGVRVERLLHVVPVHRRADAHARVQPAAGEDVDGGEVLGQPQRVLPRQRGDGGAQPDPAGALGESREDGDRRGDAVLQVPVPQPRAVECQLLAELHRRERGLVPGPGIGRVERADGQEAELVQRGPGGGHAASPRSGGSIIPDRRRCLRSARVRLT
jgi:hypothetical protein